MTDHSNYTVAAIQAPAGQIDGPVADLDWLEAQTAQAVGRGARLVLWPECAYPAYFLRSETHYRETASRRLAYAKLLDRLGQIAGRLHIFLAAGVVEERDDGRLSNAAVLFDPSGKMLLTYRKSFLWHFDHNYFVARSPADPPAVIDTALGRLGLMICADGRCPELAAIAGRAGVQLLLNPTAWVSWGRSAQTLTNPQIEYFIPARAIENGCWILSANKIGVEADSIVYCGHSNLVDPAGRTAADLDSLTPGVLLGEVDLAACRPAILPPGEGDRPAYPPLLFTATGSLPVTLNRTGAQFAQNQPLVRPQPTDALVLAAVSGPMDQFDPPKLLADLAAQAVTVVIAAGPGGGEKPRAAWVQDANQFGMMLCFADQPTPGRGVTRLRLAGGAVDSFAPARAAMLNDAQVFVVATAADERCPDMRLLRARAAENRIFVVAAAADRAAIVGPTGAILADSLADRAMAVVARLIPVEVSDKQMAPGTDVVAGRDPELYAKYLRAAEE